MSDDKTFKVANRKELLEALSKAGSQTDAESLLHTLSKDKSKVQSNMLETLGSFIEQKYGAEDVNSSQSLNDYLQKIKQADYPAIDQVRKIIYPGDVKDINATYKPGMFGNGSFITAPSFDTPIRLGNTSYDGNFTNASAKGILAHELSHANDYPAQQLLRLKEVDPIRYAKIVEQIGNTKGGEKFIDHLNNIRNKHTTDSADLLTPEKLIVYRDAVAEMPPSPLREDHSKLFNNYENALQKDLGVTKEKQLLARDMGNLDPKNIPSLKGEAINFMPDRNYMQEALELEHTPVEAEKVRSSGHHATRVDLPDDTGHFESRNINRLRKGKGLLSTMPYISMATEVIPSLVDLKQGNPNTAAARMLTSLAPAGTGPLDQKLMQEAEIADKSPELLDPTYLRTIKNIGERRMNQGKSPVVESFSGKQVDTSATSDSDVMNEIIKARRLVGQG